MQQKKPGDNAADEDLALLSRTALQHFKEGRLQQAQDECLRLLRKQQHPGAHLILGWIAHQQREFDRAVKRYQQYLAIKPNDAEAHYTLGLALGELQRIELAIEHFDKSVSIVGNNAAVHRRLGDAYAGLQRHKEAIGPYQTALALKPDDVVTIIKLANVFHGVQRYTQSIPLYERALALQPDNIQVHRHLGASLQKSGQTLKAILCFEQALILRPDYIDARIKLAQALGELGRAEEALVHLEQVIKLKPGDTEVHIILAATLRELGRAEFAIQRLEQLLDTKPDCAALYYHITMLKPKQELIPDLEELLADPRLPNRDATYCHFALGNIFQGGESFDRAFKHFRRANARYRETFVYDPKDHTQFVDRLIKAYSRHFFQRRRDLGSASQLPVFILGMPRTGSTLVEQIISSHASVHGAGELEAMPAVTHTVIQQLEYANPYPECMSLFDGEMAQEFAARYLQELALHSPTATRITDKMPGNFFRIGLIKTLFPRARIIHCQRNPLDSCISIYFSYFPELKWSFDLTELGQFYLNYQRLMSHWQNLFPGEILSVQYEELVTDQERVSRQLIDYIGLEWDEKCLDFHHNQRDVRTFSNIQVRQPMYQSSMNRWKHHEKHLQPLIDVLQQSP